MRASRRELDRHAFLCTLSWLVLLVCSQCSYRCCANPCKTDRNSENLRFPSHSSIPFFAGWDQPQCSALEVLHLSRPVKSMGNCPAAFVFFNKFEHVSPPSSFVSLNLIISIKVLNANLLVWSCILIIQAVTVTFFFFFYSNGLERSVFVLKHDQY